MTLTFAARIIDNQIECEIGSAVALVAPVFCFSLMAAARAVQGCTLIRSVAGYVMGLLEHAAQVGSDLHLR